MNLDDLDFNNFLQIKTPDTWLEYAASHLDILLIDHAHCERKAAVSALQFMSKFPHKSDLVQVMSPLAREELLHFEKVIALMDKRSIAFSVLKPSQYAYTLHKLVESNGMDERLSDQLIIGAIIEARSCERFQSLLPYLQDSEIKRFYSTLVKAEARHFKDYLRLATLYGGDITRRTQQFLQVENDFITSEDKVFRFHSGIPRDALKH